MEIVITLLIVAVAGASAQFPIGGGLGFGLPGGFSAGLDQANVAAQASHNQLQNFGKVQAGNIDYAASAIQNLWKDFHEAFHGHGENLHNGLILFGKNVEGGLSKVSPAAAGLWAGFQKQIDASINNGNQRLIEMGGAVNNNLQHGREQAAASWQAIRDNVDRPLHQSLGTWSSPRPHGLGADSDAGLHVASPSPAPLSDNLLNVSVSSN